MKNIISLLFLFIFQNVSFAQSKAIPPFEPQQYVRNIIQELDIPDAVFDKIRGKDYIVPLKLFLNEKGEVLKISIPNDEFELEPLITPIVKELPNFTPAITDGIAKSSMYNLSFLLNEYTYYKFVRQAAVPQVGMEKFLDKVRNNFYLTDLEKTKLSAAKTKENYDIVISFIIEKDGTLSSFKMADKEMEYFKDRMISAVRRASKKWMPGKYNGNPVRTLFTYTLTIKADFHSLNI